MTIKFIVRTVFDMFKSEQVALFVDIGQYMVMMHVSVIILEILFLRKQAGHLV